MPLTTSVISKEKLKQLYRKARLSGHPPCPVQPLCNGEPPCDAKCDGTFRVGRKACAARLPCDGSTSCAATPRCPAQLIGELCPKHLDLIVDSLVGTEQDLQVAVDSVYKKCIHDNRHLANRLIKLVSTGRPAVQEKLTVSLLAAETFLRKEFADCLREDSSSSMFSYKYAFNEDGCPNRSLQQEFFFRRRYVSGYLASKHGTGDFDHVAFAGWAQG